MNNLSENIKLALEGLYANKMRALLTMLGIIIGIASVITIISIGDALSSSMNESLSALGGNNVSIYLAGKTNDGTYTLSEDDYFTDEMLTRFKQHFSDRIKDVELTTNLGSGTLQNVLPKQDMKITGVNGGYATVESQKLTKGRSISTRDVDGGKNVIVISSILGKQVFGNNTNPVGKKMSIETQYGIQSFYVIGGIIGVILGAVFNSVAAVFMKTSVSLSVKSVAVAVAFSMGIGVFFGFYPANKAAKLDPIEALRYE